MNKWLLCILLGLINLSVSVKGQVTKSIETNPCGATLGNYTLSGQSWDKSTLKYAFINSLNQEMGDGKDAFYAAFSRWAAVVPFNFIETNDINEADIKILFANRQQMHDATGSEQEIACSYFPYQDKKGQILINREDFIYSMYGSNSTVNLSRVAMHELGHTLGLCHSNINNTVMYFSTIGVTELHEYDIQGIQAIYATVAIKNEFIKSDGSKINGGIVTVNNVDYNTNSMEAKFAFSQNSIRTFQAKEQITNDGREWKFNNNYLSNGGWYFNNILLGTQDIISPNVTTGTYKAIYKTKVRYNLHALTEFDGNILAGQQYNLWQFETQTISTYPDISYNNKGYKFSYWQDDYSESNPRIVTPDIDCNYTSIYKFPNHSDNNTNYQKNGQRRFVQTPNGILHKVYESMGTVWYEQSTDHGATWIIANGGKPLDITAKNPCIDNSDDNILISFQHVRKIKVRYYQYLNNAYVPKNEIYHSLGLSEDNVYPIIAASWYSDYSQIKFLLVVHNEDTGIMTLKLGYSDSGKTSIAFTAINPSTDKLYINRPGSKNSSVACLKEPTISQFHLAWDENGSIYYCPIYFKPSNTDVLEIGDTIKVSAGSGYANNRKPSTSVIWQRINGAWREDGKILWMGDQITAEEPGAPLDKIQTGSGYQTKALFRDNYEVWNGLNYDRTWSPFFSFGTNVCGVNINSAKNVNDNYYYLLGWTENNGSVSKYTNNGFTGIYNIQQAGANVTGKYLQLCNGSSLAAQNIYANIYDETALPYQFKNSGSMYFLYKENGSHGLAASRGGVVYKDNAEFYFSFGDVLVNNNKVNFVHLPDSINYSNLAEVNSLLTTEPFELNSNTPFSFSIQYGLTDSSAASALLTNDKNLNFKVLLYDVENNQVLGEYDNVTYNSNNVFQYENVNNLVNTSGINYHKVVLKLVMASNFNCNYSIAGSYSNDYALNKVGSKRIDLKNSTIVTEYGMSQNYPNPFNPATTISYQLPKNGQVTIKVYDMLGREIKTLVNENKPAGRYTVSFDAGSLSSGVYIYRIVAGDYTAAKKMTLIK